MNLRTFWPVAALAIAALSACGTAPGGTTPAPGGATDTATTDAVKTDADAAAGDAKDGSETPLDAAADGAGNTDATADGIDPNKACCQAAGASCGFTAKCPAKCGDCKAGETCKANKCEAGPPPVQKKKFGEYCGPSAACPQPKNGAPQTEWTAYFGCLDGQCDDGQCRYDVCTKPCTFTKDQKINHSGADGQDGIEDPDGNACDGAVDGPAGPAFRCVELASAAQVQQGQTQQTCVPGAAMKPCKGSLDCTGGEVCGYRYFYGAYRTVCVPKYKNVNPSKAAGKFGEKCIDDQKDGDLQFCENNLCFNNGKCAAFCKDNSDCAVPGVQCKDGKCPGGSACKNDAECAPFECRQAAVFGDKNPKVGLCLGKKCKLDEDCGGSEYFCRYYINGVKSEAGDPDPDDPKAVILPDWDPSCEKLAPGKYAKKGEQCTDVGQDSTKVPLCSNIYGCEDGYCGGPCKTDAECPANMHCGVREYTIDIDQDKIVDYSLAKPTCLPGGAKAPECASAKDCASKTEPQCFGGEIVQQLPGAATGTTFTSYDYVGKCLAPISPDFKGFGEPCGADTGFVCKSGLCLQTGGGTTYCTELCDSKASCPPVISINGKEQKTICAPVQVGFSNKYHNLDMRVYAPSCVSAGSAGTLADCSKDFKCTDPNEACLPFAIAWGPNKPAKVEYLCDILTAPNQPKPSKKVGEACNTKPAADAAPECAYGCMPDDTDGKGYCTAICKSNADCGSNDNMFCDLEHQSIPRADKSKAAIVPICMKKKACLPCNWHNNCATGFSCTNLGTKAAFKGRCALSCKSDDDCSGGTCEPAKDWKGADFANGLKVCKPNCK